MTKTEEQTIRNLIERLQKPNCGCSNWIGTDAKIKAVNDLGIEAVSRIYLNTWIIPSLQMLLPGKERDPDLALRMSR